MKRSASMFYRPTCTPTMVMFVSLLAFAGGCAPTGEKMADSFSRTRTNVADSRAQVADTQTALKIVRMARGDGMKDAYKHYKKNVEDLEKAGAEAKRRALALKEQSDTHIQAWEEEQKHIKDP